MTTRGEFKMMFRKYYFTKEAFEKVGLDIDKPYGLVHFVRPLMSLFRVDGISVSYPEMSKMITGDVRQNWLTKDKNTNHYLFLEHDKVDGNAHYIVNKNFDWDWYEKQCEEVLLNQNPVDDENINELYLLRSIADMINKEFHCKGYPSEWKNIPTNIKKAMDIWNEKFNRWKVK